jgi:hypothetical protein
MTAHGLDLLHEAVGMQTLPFKRGYRIEKANYTGRSHTYMYGFFQFFHSREILYQIRHDTSDTVRDPCRRLISHSRLLSAPVCDSRCSVRRFEHHRPPD